jgi:hypothetical protein
MDEAEWLACAEPRKLLFLDNVCPDGPHLEGGSGKVDPRVRKVMLFVVACLRRIWDGIEGEAFRRAAESVEDLAEGRVAFWAWWSMHAGIRGQRNRTRAQDAVVEAMFPKPRYAAVGVARCAAYVVAGETDRAARKAEKRKQCHLLRDLFGSPFRPVTFHPSWRSNAVVALATAAYTDRDFTVMPVLADALEEAGCSDEQILTHCRSPGEHARGCFVLDLVLCVT